MARELCRGRGVPWAARRGAVARKPASNVGYGLARWSCCAGLTASGMDKLSPKTPWARTDGSGDRRAKGNIGCSPVMRHQCWHASKTVGARNSWWAQNCRRDGTRLRCGRRMARRKIICGVKRATKPRRQPCASRRRSCGAQGGGRNTKRSLRVPQRQITGSNHELRRLLNLQMPQHKRDQPGYRKTSSRLAYARSRQ